MATTPPKWNLTDLYKSINDPKINKHKNEITKLADSFTRQFKGKLKTALPQAVLKYEEIDKKLTHLLVYAYLTYSTKTADPKVSKFYQSLNEYSTEVLNKLIWYGLEIMQMEDKVFGRVIKKNPLNKYEHYLKHLRVFKKYRLDEDKEILLNKKSQTGASAFVRLYDQSESADLYTFEGKKLNHSEIINIFSSDPDRNKRKKAGESISDKLNNQSALYTFILNTLLLNSKIEHEIRGYKYPQEKTFLRYEVDKKTVDTMVSSITKNYSISERYYIAKSKYTKQKLYEWDRYNTIHPEVSTTYTFDQAKKIILESFHQFSPRFHDIAKEFFDKKWIDAAVYKGKQSGGYCYSSSPDMHPYIFVNYTDDESSARTLAHELGHGIHGQLSRVNNDLEYHTSTASAEIASIFAELLVFDVLYEKAKTKKEKINLLGGKLQEIFATVFRQNAFYLFESEIHRKRRASGELSANEIDSLYQKFLQPMFGKGLTLSDNHKNMWMKISHFYHYNFYVFTYSMGQLLAISLYAKYKADGQKFVEKYIKALSLGGSKSPKEIISVMGIDITKKDFWQKGLDLIDLKVKEFEQLVI